MPGALQKELVDPFPGNVVHLSIREAQQNGHKKTWKKTTFFSVATSLTLLSWRFFSLVTGKGFAYISLASRGSGMEQISTLAENSGVLYILLFKK